MGVYKRGTVWWVNLTAPNGTRICRSAGTDDQVRAQEFHDRLKVQLWEEQRLGVKPERRPQPLPWLSSWAQSVSAKRGCSGLRPPP